MCNFVRHFWHADVNECRAGIAKCEQHCNNTLGSFHCYCQRGFTLNPDRWSCDGEARAGRGGAGRAGPGLRVGVGRGGRGGFLPLLLSGRLHPQPWWSGVGWMRRGGWDCAGWAGAGRVGLDRAR